MVNLDLCFYTLTQLKVLQMYDASLKRVRNDLCLLKAVPNPSIVDVHKKAVLNTFS